MMRRNKGFIDAVVRYCKEEIKVIRERDPAMHSDFEVFLYASFWAVLWDRVAHALD